MASAADKIVAHPSSVTGSIGVIMLTVNASGLLEKIGLEAEAVTSGPKKDMGSPFRPMTEDERAIFQDVIPDCRPMPVAERVAWWHCRVAGYCRTQMPTAGVRIQKPCTVFDSLPANSGGMKPNRDTRSVWICSNPI